MHDRSDTFFASVFENGSTLLHSIHSSHFQDIKKTSGITARGFICTY